VVIDIDPELTDIEIDANRFKQVLGAILENAGQHTRDGIVTVMARRAIGASNRFHVRVADSGTGIPADVLKTLFETFTATRDAATGRFGGTGTNLTVVHRLCGAMGGSISAESMVGVGSTFTITMPVTQERALPHRLAA